MDSSTFVADTRQSGVLVIATRVYFYLVMHVYKTICQCEPFDKWNPPMGNYQHSFKSLQLEKITYIVQHIFLRIQLLPIVKLLGRGVDLNLMQVLHDRKDPTHPMEPLLEGAWKLEYQLAM